MSVVSVIGAGGQTGILCVEELLQQGYKVKALVRSPDKYKDKLPSSQSLDVVKADVTQYGQLKEALQGSDYVIIASGASSGKVTKDVEYLGVEATAQISAQLGVKRLVMVSSMLVNPKNRLHPFRIILDTAVWNVCHYKWLGEESIRKSDVKSYTIIRPGGLTNGPGGQVNLYACQGDDSFLQTFFSLLCFTTRHDVARVSVEALKNDGAHNKTFETFQHFQDMLFKPQIKDDQLKLLFKDLKQGVY